MNRITPAICLLLACSAVTAAEPELLDRDARTRILDKTEPRIRAIYDRGEFRPRPIEVTWLPDGSGYTTVEPSPGVEKSVVVRYAVPGGERTVVGPAGRGDRRGVVSPDGSMVVFARDGDLYVRPVGSEGQDTATRLTHDGADDGVSSGDAAWSPDGTRVVFVRTDSSQVRVRADLPRGDPSYPEVRRTRFARVGGAIPRLRVGTVDAEGKAVRWLPVPEPAEGYYLGRVEWAGGGDILIEWMSRFRNERNYYLADADTGAVRRIFHEADKTWVVASYAINAGLEWVRNGQAFIVLSETDGWRRAYLYSRGGKPEAVLTPPGVDVIQRGRADEARGWYYYYASPDNATQKYLYRVRLDGSGGAERVTPQDQPGTHAYDISPDCGWAVHTHSAFDRPPVTDLVKLPAHESVRVVEDNKAVHDRAEQVIPRPTEFLKLDADGVSLDAWLITPTEFDPAKKYPVFVYVYGEPHAQTVLDEWGKSQADFHRAVADMGYLVVSIENRGTPAPKGAAWRRAVFGCLGPITVTEQAAALKDLGRQKSYADLSRVGIWGWSGGGSNTLNAVFRRPDTFHVGIAVAPKPQPHLYNAWFQEIYMHTPATNPDGYKRAAPINFAEGLTGDLLIVHGTGETNTHVQIVEGLVDRLIELGKRFDYMSYPHLDHGLKEGPGAVVHVRMHIARYLLEHLPPGPR